jgi:DNA-binding response OmpR family regulator
VARVLIVHDDAAAAQQLCGLLKRAGFEGTPVTDAFAAGLRIALARPDLIVVDLAMRSPDAFEMAAELRAHPETRRVPILAVSGSRDERAQKKALAVFDEVLAKPVDFEILRRKVDAALRARKAA